ncbi:hypothetical protein DPSP01_010794 [Paraphaeosphaeria sporulosa]|uniref:Uncharacterized protein n=1 Tax=Paraphaeosphaeria sporulosa TaxID=1460663 RepID=A0A177C1J9_9PLEO|nr:uncharacterized protein CC84DRAFT_185832 [Paraphaeosphaeria sporulosa]OAG01306.1 hypothetical protein CC84DRAFT_185832 [Paraphaeosphaeria sporulosa]
MMFLAARLQSYIPSLYVSLSAVSFSVKSRIMLHFIPSSSFEVVVLASFVSVIFTYNQAFLVCHTTPQASELLKYDCSFSLFREWSPASLSIANLPTPQYNFSGVLYTNTKLTCCLATFTM